MWMDKETDDSVTGGTGTFSCECPVLQAAPATALPFAALPAAGGLNVIFVFLFQRKKVDLQGSE